VAVEAPVAPVGGGSSGGKTSGRGGVGRSGHRQERLHILAGSRVFFDSFVCLAP